MYPAGSRVVILDGGPPLPGTVLPSPEGMHDFIKLVQLDGDEDPVKLTTEHIVPLTFAPRRRVFRHSGGPHRYGHIPTLGDTPKTLSKARMLAEEDSVVVRWDNGELELVATINLTPIVFSLKDGGIR